MPLYIAHCNIFADGRENDCGIVAKYIGKIVCGAAFKLGKYHFKPAYIQG